MKFRTLKKRNCVNVYIYKKDFYEIPDWNGYSINIQEITNKTKGVVRKSGNNHKKMTEQKQTKLKFDESYVWFA